MKKLLSLFVLILSAEVVFAQQESDTLRSYRLDEVVVTGYDGNRKLLDTPGAISLIPDVQLASFDQTSVVASFNTVPGIRFEQRAPGSYRIAIRGSTLRSPFGVRNVKIYWNDIPITQPSGSTDLNLLDTNNFQKVEVIKGPAGSIYGAGTGGAILINSFSNRGDGTSYQTGFTGGSYDLRRFNNELKTRFSGGVLNVKYARQLSDGYRQQSFFQRDAVEVSSRFTISPKHVFSTSILYSDLNYGIPGGLTREQFADDPKQARPGNQFVLGSVEANASIDHQAFLMGVTSDYQFSDNFSSKTTVYGLFSDFENPFNFDFKRDSRKTGGGRTRFSHDRSFGEIKARFIGGAEFQLAKNVARNFENDSGSTGALNFDDELKSWQLLVFTKGEFELPKNWILTLGASFNSIEYDINRLVDNIGGEPQRVVRNFDPILVPRIGLVKKLSPSVSVHGSIGYGFSPPTIEEVRTNEGSINLDLDPEEGINYELGIRGNALSGKLDFDVSGFYFRLTESIVQQQSDRGTVLFRNTGSTNQIGAEIFINYALINNRNRFLSRLDWQASYTRHSFEFDDYVKNGQDFSGNDLTGVAPNIFVTSMNAHTKAGFYGQLSYNFTDEIPLDDANSVFSNSYHLLKVKAGIKRELFPGFSADLFAGVDNLLDETYSLGNDLNAFGDRFFQPAAERNWFLGIQFRIQ